MSRRQRIVNIRTRHSADAKNFEESVPTHFEVGLRFCATGEQLATLITSVTCLGYESLDDRFWLRASERSFRVPYPD